MRHNYSIIFLQSTKSSSKPPHTATHTTLKQTHMVLIIAATQSIHTAVQ